MYVSIILGLLALAAWIAWRDRARRRLSRTLLAAALAIGTPLSFALLSFATEQMWFEALGYSEVFWRRVGVTAGATSLGGTVSGLGVYLLLNSVGPSLRAQRWTCVLAGVFAGAAVGFVSWDETLLFLHSVPTGTTEPVYGRDTAFYLFVLPFLDRVLVLLLVTACLGLLFPVYLAMADRRKDFSLDERSLHRPLAMLAVVGAIALVISRYHLLYSQWGVVAGAGWTDVNVRIPAYWATALGTVLLGLAPACSKRLRQWSTSFRAFGTTFEFGALRGVWSLIGVIWLSLLVLLPNLVQSFVVVPNEITFETQYIAHNISFTRQGFRLHEVEERQFPANETLTRGTVERSANLLAEARLWDARALDAVYRQFQEIRLYYSFHDVDIDRYTIGDRYRQVMVSARELQQEHLPKQSQTFINRRFKYTHGYGLTLATVRDFTPDGRPHLLVKDIPPRSEAASLQVDRPQIYYGELTAGPAVVKSREPEFDYPSGDENVSTFYDGYGGVELRTLWRKFALGWRFDGTRFFFSTYMTPETRVLFRRRVQDRVAAVAPFLELDEDPYIVLVEGKLYWIVDGYTTSTYYPYSAPFLGRESDSTEDVVSRLQGVNHVRNSVKAVVDAYNGETTLYIFDPEDPIAAAWQQAFPTLFRPAGEMPPALRSHVRYPDGFLLVQGLVYAKYHMANPEVFYNQEDLWVRATEKYYAEIQPLEPYYVMWQLPESDRAEFVLMLPFTPKNRQVMIGWIAGLCDGENYGRFLAYKFPKERRVLGPQQVETKIDQHRFLSSQLTLWDQHGSAVIRGNVLALPLDDTLLYVEPIYLQAETAAYPELRLVVMMHGDHLSYGETFEEALGGLFAGKPSRPTTAGASPYDEPLAARASRANQLFEQYLQLLGDGHFLEAAGALEELQGLLRELADLETAEPN